MPRMKRSKPHVAAIAWMMAAAALSAQQPPVLQKPPEVERRFADPGAYVPDMTRLAASASELRDLVDRFALDRQALQRFYTVPGSNERRTRLRAFQAAWLQALLKVDFAKLSREGQVDYILLRNQIEYSLKLLDREERHERETDPLLPFEEDIVTLHEDRQKLRFIKSDAAVTALALLGERIKTTRAAIESGLTVPAGESGASAIKATRLAAQRAALQAERLRSALEQWFVFYNGYDPEFTKSVPSAYREVSQSLIDYTPT
jgi:hypothetical protein